MTDITADLCAAALATTPGTPNERRAIGRMIADTLAVAWAGFGTPTLRRACSALAAPGGGGAAWNGRAVAGHEDAALLNGAAAHALDYDDLETESAAHLNAVVLAALCSGSRWPDEDDLLAAMRAGIVVAQAVGRRLGPEHYGAGWHATATVGVLAATAAVARAERIDAATLGNALALAAAQSAGLHANFGTPAKAIQAGMAAGAAIRSIRLARTGVVGGPALADVAFFRLYGATAHPRVATMPMVADLDAVVPKLFPCCFAAHRLIEAAQRARDAMPGAAFTPDMRIVATVPTASLRVLRIDLPVNGVEAAFSARYCVAAALRDGAPGLRHFTDPVEPALLALAARIEIVAANGGAEHASTIRHGSATLELAAPGHPTRVFAASGLPGADAAILRRKFADCFAVVVPGATAAPLLARLRTMTAVAPWLEEVTPGDTQGSG